MRTVILDIHPDGSMHVTIDGTPLPPQDDGRPWSRASFPQIIDHASEDRAVPVRVQVHEADGTSFTDLLPARPPRRTSDAEQPTSEPKPRKHKQTPRLIEVAGEGFVAGEDVACCLIASHTEAAPDGNARVVLDTKQAAKALQAGAGEVMLIGRVSGHVVTRGLP